MGRRDVTIPDRFRGKTWIAWVYVVFPVALGLPMLLVGLDSAPPQADDPRRAGPGAAPPFTIFGAVLLAYAVLAFVALRARSRPVIRLYAEGAAFDRYCCKVIDGDERSTGSIVLVWSSLCDWAGAQRYLYASWRDLSSVDIVSLPLSRGLLVDGLFYRRGDPEPEATQIVLSEQDFRGRLEPVVAAIRRCARKPEVRQSLPSWSARAMATA
jgi:hypothetical protein